MSGWRGFLPTVKRMERRVATIHEKARVEEMMRHEEAKLEASASIWVMFATCVVLVFILGVANRVLDQRISLLISEVETLRGRVGRSETTLDHCSADLQAWHKWLAIREAGHGSAWWLRRKPEEVDQ